MSLPTRPAAVPPFQPATQPRRAAATAGLILAGLFLSNALAPCAQAQPERGGPPREGRQSGPRDVPFPGPGGPPPGIALGFGGSPPGASAQSLNIDAARLESYAELLNLDDAQREAATALLDGTQSEFAAQRTKFREELDTLRQNVQRNADPSVLIQRMPELMREQAASATTLHDSFLADLRTLLTPEQDTRWPFVERADRRDSTLSRGRLAYESVDLISLIRKLKLTPEQLAPLSEVLAQYELQLDRALAERNKVVDEADAMLRGDLLANQQLVQTEEFKRLRAKAREARTKLRDVNRTTARQLAALLPSAKQPEFETTLQKQAFPRIYGDSEPSRTTSSALALEDLTPQQEQAIKDLKAGWESRTRAANAQWAEALVKLEETQEGYETALAPFGPRDPESPLGKARAERRAADRQYLDSLRSVLTDSQRERLPSRRDRFRQLAQGGDIPDAIDFDVLEDLGDLPPPPPGGGPIIRTVTIGPDGQTVEDTEVQILAPGAIVPGGPPEGEGEVEIHVVNPDGTPAPAGEPAPRPDR